MFTLWVSKLIHYIAQAQHSTAQNQYKHRSKQAAAHMHTYIQRNTHGAAFRTAMFTIFFPLRSHGKQRVTCECRPYLCGVRTYASVCMWVCLSFYLYLLEYSMLLSNTHFVVVVVVVAASARIDWIREEKKQR